MVRSGLLTRYRPCRSLLDCGVGHDDASYRPQFVAIYQFQRFRREEVHMSMTLETLQAEILRLSRTDRARLLDRLIAGLDSDAEGEAEWDALADNREQELDLGSAQPVPLDVAIARLEARFPG